jgi:hypothetical protein
MSVVPSVPTGSRTALTLRAGTWRDDAVPRSLGLGRLAAGHSLSFLAMARHELACSAAWPLEGMVCPHSH